MSSFCFGTSGPFAKTLFRAGWSPGAAVTWRVGGAALLLVPFAMRALHGRWQLLRTNAGFVVAFGLLAVAMPQFGYFNAANRLSVAVAMLLEYLGVVLVVGWVWLVERHRPHPITLAGVAVAIGGLLCVLEVFGGIQLSWIGVAWGFVAASGLAAFYVMASHEHRQPLPPICLSGFGLAVGAVGLAVLSATGLIGFTMTTSTVTIRSLRVAWWVPVGELAVVAAGLAYAAGTLGTRLAGSTVASFVGLSEVLFATLTAWAVLGERPGIWQVVGGALILAGVVGVRIGEARQAGPGLLELPLPPDSGEAA